MRLPQRQAYVVSLSNILNIDMFSTFSFILSGPAVDMIERNEMELDNSIMKPFIYWRVVAQAGERFEYGATTFEYLDHLLQALIELSVPADRLQVALFVVFHLPG